MRQTLKRVLVGFAMLLAAPLWLLHRLASRLGDSDSSLHSLSQLVSLLPGRSGRLFRAAFYHLVLPDTASNTAIEFLTVLSHADTRIGSRVYIGPQGNIGLCDIGDASLFGSGVHVLSGKAQHSFADASRPIQDQGGTFERVSIGADVWVGNGAIIMADVGAGSIVAAGSVVTRPVPVNTIVAGNPAREVGRRG